MQVNLILGGGVDSYLLTILILIATFSLSSCSTFSVWMHHKNLDVKTKMSETIFLDPIPKNKKVVYIQVKNTTSESLDNIGRLISKDLQKKDWVVNDDLDKASTMIQVNILQAGETNDINSVWGSINSGYGNAMSGVFTGLATGLLTNNALAGTLTGLTASTGDWIGSFFVENKVYSVVADVQISQRSSVKVKQVSKANLSQGSSTQVQQSYENESNWIKYRVRVGSVAEQVNLTFEKASPEIQKQLAQQIAGILD